MFVPASELQFNLKDLIERCIAQWSAIQSAGVIQAATESYGEFIAAELNATDLRTICDQRDDALFNASASEAQFRDAVIAGSGPLADRDGVATTDGR